MFYDKVLSLCRARGISPSGLADELEIRRSTVTLWKKGATPQVRTVKKVAEYFSVPTEYFLTDTPIDTDLQSFHDSNNLESQEEELLKVFKTLSNKNKALALARIYELEEDQNK